jgi:hypothetical protein
MALPRFQQRDHIYTLGPPLLPVANPVPQLPNEYAVLSSLAPGQQVLGLPVNLDKDAPWVMRRRALRIKYDSTQSGTTHIFTGINQLMVRFTGHDQHYLQQSPVPQNLDGAFFGQFGAWKPSFPGVAFPAGGTFLVDIINNGPATLTNVTLYFRGVKLFPWGVRPDYRYPAVVSSIPYAYPINWTPASSVTNPLGAVQNLGITEVRLSQVFQIQDDADFVIRAMATGPVALVSTYEVFLIIRDFDQKPYSTGWVHHEVYGGQTTDRFNSFPSGGGFTPGFNPYGTGASLPNVWFPEIYVPRNQVLFYDIMRLDSAFPNPPTVAQDFPITMIGAKIFDRTA